MTATSIVSPQPETEVIGSRALEAVLVSRARDAVAASHKATELESTRFHAEVAADVLYRRRAGLLPTGTTQLPAPVELPPTRRGPSRALSPGSLVQLIKPARPSFIDPPRPPAAVFDFHQPFYAGDPTSWPSAENMYAHSVPERGYVELWGFLYPGDPESTVDDQGVLRSKRVEAQLTAGPLYVGPQRRTIDMYAGYGTLGSITTQVLSFNFFGGPPLTGGTGKAWVRRTYHLHATPVFDSEQAHHAQVSAVDDASLGKDDSLLQQNMKDPGLLTLSFDAVNEIYWFTFTVELELVMTTDCNLAVFAACGREGGTLFPDGGVFVWDIQGTLT